jgi:hypothetical protein
MIIISKELKKQIIKTTYNFCQYKYVLFISGFFFLSLGIVYIKNIILTQDIHAKQRFNVFIQYVCPIYRLSKC